MNNMLEKATQAAKYIREQITETPDIAIVLGSGLGNIADKIQNKIEISYSQIPNFPVSKVEGHSNKLIFGKIYGKKVIAMKGRFHFYEGYTAQEVAFPIKVFTLLGVNSLILSNAAGGVNKTFKPGTLMLINDHIKLTSISPLVGENVPEFGERFPDMSCPYSERLIDIAQNVAKSMKIELREGVYAFMPGPQYETRAELKMLEILGADAVGMSTVPEVISAVHSGMEVLGISCITNVSGSKEPLTHEEVLEVASQVENTFGELVLKIIDNM